MTLSLKVRSGSRTGSIIPLTGPKQDTELKGYISLHISLGKIPCQPNVPWM